MVRSVSEPPPVAVCPPVCPSRDMGGRVTEVVGSYEEILFVVDAVTAFLEPDLNPEHLEHDGGGDGGVDGPYLLNGYDTEHDRTQRADSHAHGDDDVPPPPPPLGPGLGPEPGPGPELELSSPDPLNRRSMFRRRSSLVPGSWGGRRGSVRMPIAHGGGYGDGDNAGGASAAEAGAGAVMDAKGGTNAKDIHIDTGSSTESDQEAKYDSDGAGGGVHGEDGGVHQPSRRHRRLQSGDSSMSDDSNGSSSSSSSSSGLSDDYFIGLGSGNNRVGGAVGGAGGGEALDELISFEVILRVEGLRFVLLDNLLGLHLPGQG